MFGGCAIVQSNDGTTRYRDSNSLYALDLAARRWRLLAGQCIHGVCDRDEAAPGPRAGCVAVVDRQHAWVLGGHRIGTEEGEAVDLRRYVDMRSEYVHYVVQCSHMCLSQQSSVYAAPGLWVMAAGAHCRPHPRPAGPAQCSRLALEQPHLCHRSPTVRCCTTALRVHAYDNDTPPCRCHKLDLQASPPTWTLLPGAISTRGAVPLANAWLQHVDGAQCTAYCAIRAAGPDVGEPQNPTDPGGLDWQLFSVQLGQGTATGRAQYTLEQQPAADRLLAARAREEASFAEWQDMRHRQAQIKVCFYGYCPCGLMSAHSCSGRCLGVPRRRRIPRQRCGLGCRTRSFRLAIIVARWCGSFRTSMWHGCRSSPAFLSSGERCCGAWCSWASWRGLLGRMGSVTTWMGCTAWRRWGA